MKKLNYKTGDWFLIPLKGGASAIGRIARGAPPVLFGYFFLPERDVIPSLEGLAVVDPSQAVLKARFGDLGLINGSWRIIGSSPWNPREWAMPSFIRTDVISNVPYLISYSDQDLRNEREIRPAIGNEADTLPTDGLSGYGAIEMKLLKLLNQSGPRIP